MPEGQEDNLYQNNPAPIPPSGNVEFDEKKELLKRGEIRTMEKDLAKLRETEAEEERKKISSLKPDEETPETREKEPKEIKEEEAPGVLIPKKIRRPSSFQKILVRTLAVIVLFLAIGFFYWLLTEKMPGEPAGEETAPPLEEKTTEESLSPEQSETGTEGAGAEEEEEGQEESVEEEPAKEEAEISEPKIIENIVSWGYYIPETPRVIDTIILHSAYNALDGDPHDIGGVIEEFMLYKVTSHYLISRDGMIYQLAPDAAVAYQAGRGQMPDGTRKNIINNFSIGVEMVYTDTEQPNEIQLARLLELVSYLKQKYDVPIENILEHEDISSSGKDDPWNWEKDELLNLLE